MSVILSVLLYISAAKMKLSFLFAHCPSFDLLRFFTALEKSQNALVPVKRCIFQYCSLDKVSPSIFICWSPGYLKMLMSTTPDCPPTLFTVINGYNDKRWIPLQNVPKVMENGKPATPECLSIT